MSQTWSSKRLSELLPRRAWLVIFALALVVVLTIVAHGCTAFKGVAVDVRLNTNGVATVWGIPLGSGFIRDFTLRALSKGHFPVRILVPSGGSGAPGWDTNSVQTMNAIMKAGLVPTNKPSGPSPYE